MAIELQLNLRSQQSSYLTEAQIDANWNAIIAAFAQVNSTLGTVTQVNGTGFAGVSLAVANQTTTPYITLATTLNGFVTANGSGFGAVPSISLTSDVSDILPIANGGIGTDTLTTDRVPYFDGTSFVSSSVSSTELGYLQGVTSGIQSQLDGKEPTITYLTYAKGGLNGSFASRQAALNSLTASSGATTNQVLTRNSGGDAVWTTISGATQWTTTGSGIEYNGGNVTFSAFSYNNSNKSISQAASSTGQIQYVITNTNTAGSANFSLVTDGSGGSFSVSSFGSTHVQASTYDIPSSTWINTTNTTRWSYGNNEVYWYGLSYIDVWLRANTNGMSIKGGLILGGILHAATESVTVANTTTETSVVGDGQPGVLPIIPADILREGASIRITGYGYYSAVSNPNITLKIKYAGTTIISTGAVTATNATNEVFKIETILTCRTSGATGTLMGQGVYTEASGVTYKMYLGSAATIDTTTDSEVGVTVQWGTASASNTFTMSNLCVELIGGVI